MDRKKGEHGWIATQVRQIFTQKLSAGCAGNCGDTLVRIAFAVLECFATF
jgi:hypothetical protein